MKKTIYAKRICESVYDNEDDAPRKVANNHDTIETTPLNVRRWLRFLKVSDL